MTPKQIQAIAIRMQQDAMPDPHDERDTSPAWLAERLRNYAAQLIELAKEPPEATGDLLGVLAEYESLLNKPDKTDAEREAWCRVLGVMEALRAHEPEGLQRALALLSELDGHMQNMKWDENATGRRKLREVRDALTKTDTPRMHAESAQAFPGCDCPTCRANRIES